MSSDTPHKAPYEDLLNRLLVTIAIGTVLYFVGFDRLNEIFKFSNPHDGQPWHQSASNQQNQNQKSTPTPILKASDHHSDAKRHLLIAATGSVATIKIPLILHALSQQPNLSIRLIVSKSARQFLQGQSTEQPSLASLSKIQNVDGIYFDEHEWSKPWVRGDTILHIELRRWADLLVVAPLSANGLAKISQGMSDDLVSSVIRAWDFSGLIDGARPGVPLPYDMRKSKEELEALPESFREGRKKGIMVAPAMNTAMWNHPATAKHLAILEQEWGVENGGWFEVLRPMKKMLACGDTGSGAMKDWKEIVGVIEQRLRLSNDTNADSKKG